MAFAAFGKSCILLRTVSIYHSGLTSAITRSISTRDALTRLHRDFEDLMEEQRIRMAAPDWLPFLPGSSYWIPGSRHYPLHQQQEEEPKKRSRKREEYKENNPRVVFHLVFLDCSSDSEN